MITKKGVFGIVQGHANRHLAIDPRTGALFVGVGSSGNIGVEPEVKASIQRFEPDGSGQTTFASGLRNATALAFHPDTGELYAVVQERDGLGDRLVPDFLTRVERGAFYGWPYAYIGPNPQPGFAQMRPDKVKASVTPDLLFEAHSSAMDIVFYNGEQFPAGFRGSAFVVLQRLVEPVRADRLQGGARAVQGRQAGGLLREFRHRLLGFGPQPGRGLGSAGGAGGDARGCAAGRRRHRRHDLARRLRRSPAIRSDPVEHHRRRAAVRPRPAPVAPLPSSR